MLLGRERGLAVLVDVCRSAEDGRAAPLPTGPGGRTLLEERAHALLGVGSLGVRGHHAASQLVRAALVELDLLVERLLPDANGQWAGGCHPGNQPDHRLLETAGRHDPVDESPLTPRFG